MVKKILTAFIWFIIIIVIADLVGVVLVTLFDIVFRRFDSGALFYAIWFVIGVFGGIFYMATCQQGSKNQNTPVGGILAVVVALIFSGLLIFIFHQLGEMRTNVAKYDYYVPGHKYVTYTFFITFVATAFLSRISIVQKEPAEQKII